MVWLRRGLGAALAAVLIAGALVGGGLVAHSEAVVVSAVPEAQTVDGKPRLRVTVRNRLAALVPVAGSSFQPAFTVERRTPAGTWEPEQVSESEGESTWLWPFQRARFTVVLPGSGTYRIVARSGREPAVVHASGPISVQAAVAGRTAEASIEDIPRLTH